MNPGQKRRRTPRSLREKRICCNRIHNITQNFQRLEATVKVVSFKGTSLLEDTRAM